MPCDVQHFLYVSLSRHSRTACRAFITLDDVSSVLEAALVEMQQAVLHTVCTSVLVKQVNRQCASRAALNPQHLCKYGYLA